MIKIDFILAISLFLSFSSLLVFSMWMFYNHLRDSGNPDNVKFLQQCPYCTYVFINYDEIKELQICPRCKSYLSMGENNAKQTKGITT